MPRTARLHSSTGIYHIILRGINRQAIFLSYDDYCLFLDTLSLYKEKCNFEIYAFCIMTNHIHLMIGITPESESLESIFKKIGTRFVYWYNERHSRVGHLFQDRFHSEPVETEQYFRTLFRYIIQNPIKAGMETTLGDYPWTSFKAYNNTPDNITDTKRAIDVFGDIDWLREFIHQTNVCDYVSLHAYPPAKISDTDALSIILKISRCESIEKFQNYSNKQKDIFIEKFLQHHISGNQIQRLTGISKDKITKVKKGLAS